MRERETGEVVCERDGKGERERAREREREREMKTLWLLVVKVEAGSRPQCSSVGNRLRLSRCIVILQDIIVISAE